MKKITHITLLSLILITILTFINSYVQKETNITVISSSERDNYEKFLNNHPFNKEKFTLSELQKMPPQDRPDLAWRQNYLATMNPNLGYPEQEKLLPIFKMTKKLQKASKSLPGSTGAPWIERGPNNVGGRTRAIAWDPTSTNKVWAGGVTGGLWFNNNITDVTTSWKSINDFWDNIAITAIVFDPNNSNIMYVGTGEGWSNTGLSSRGAGIWKSIDGGASFSQLNSTQDFFYINDMVVRNENGTSVIYAAVTENSYEGEFHGNSEGLQRSTDGGTTWNQVLPSVGAGPEGPTDLDISAANNELWVAVADNSFGEGGGKIYSSNDGTTFNLKYTHHTSGRVNIACAPSDSNYIYAAFEVDQEMDDFKQSTNGGTSWTSKSEPNDADFGIPSTDFTRGQAWYDLTLDVDPNNRDVVIIGGIDLFNTNDGGDSWTQISKWSNNPGLGVLNVSLVHADQHAIVYKPGSSSTVIFGNDGGVYYSSTATSAPPAFTIDARILDYNVTQYYACAIHPTAGRNEFLAGSQDNGTQRYISAGINATTTASGGDGGFCHIDQTNPLYQTTSFIRNVIFHSFDEGSFFDPFGILNDQTTGRFINPSDLDNHQNILYTYRDTLSLYRITDMESTTPTIGTINIPSLGAEASHLSVSPYTTNSTTLFVGTESGRVFKITTADGTPNSTEITGASFPLGSVSCITFGQNEDEILVTFSNYGVNSIWYTSNGGTSWSSKEGDLPDMPVRWALFNPLDFNEVILATEVGVWGSSNVNTASPNWTASNSGLANVRVDMLQLRSSDNEVIAATHGRGLFSSSGFNGPAPDITWTSQPSDVTIECDASRLPTNTGNATANTACGLGGLIVSYTDTSVAVAGSCANDSIVTRTWIAVDDCGNNVSFTQTINVHDSTPPVITCPPAQTQLVTNGTDTVLLDYSSMATISDNCSDEGNITITQSPAIGSTQSIGTIVVTLTATDECGNSSQCNFNVVIDDPISISERSFLANTTIYPNPTNGIFTVDFGSDENENLNVVVYNLFGELVYEKNDITGKTSYINIQHLNKGIYYIHVNNSKSSIIKKILLI